MIEEEEMGREETPKPKAEPIKKDFAGLFYFASCCVG